MWLTDLAFLMDLTMHLNELSVCLQGENNLICAMFQAKTAFEMANDGKQIHAF